MAMVNDGTYEIEANSLAKAGLDYLFLKGIEEDYLKPYEADATKTHAFLSIEESNERMFDRILDVVREHNEPDSYEQLLDSLSRLSDAAVETAEQIGQRLAAAMFRAENIAQDVIGTFAKEDHFRAEVDRVCTLLGLAADWSNGTGFDRFDAEASRIRRKLMYAPESSPFEASLCVLRYAYENLQNCLIQTAYERLKARIILAADHAGSFPYVKQGKCLKTMSLSTKYIGRHYHDITGLMQTLDNETEDSPVAILFERYELKRRHVSELLISLRDLYEFAHKQEKALICMVSGYLLNDIDAAYFTLALRDHLLSVPDVKSITLGPVEEGKNMMTNRMSVILASDALIDIEVISQYGTAEILLRKNCPDDLSNEQEKELEHLLTNLQFYIVRKDHFAKVKMA